MLYPNARLHRADLPKRFYYARHRGLVSFDNSGQKVDESCGFLIGQVELHGWPNVMTAGLPFHVSFPEILNVRWLTGLPPAAVTPPASLRCRARHGRP